MTFDVARMYNSFKYINLTPLSCHTLSNILVRGLVSVSIMGGISGHGAGGLISQWGSTIKPT